MQEITLKNFNNNVAIFQLENLSDTQRIETYMKSLNSGSIVLLGEYVIDSFFLQSWEKKPPTKLKSKNKLDFLNELSMRYSHTIVAPCVQYHNKGYYKNMLILENGKTHAYAQQRLIQYEHWNEAKFFANDVSRLPKLPLTFRANGFRFGVLFGFEAHFDEFWMEFKNAGVDVVLVASASTFSSQSRWQNLLLTHSFTNSCYVFRANRIGKILNAGYEWDFYGHSFVSLGQNMLDSLDDKEGMLCIELNPSALNDLKTQWGFRI